jgi:acyl-CoA reductase-like NAD-dependent aldehyde dehydrogenase
MSSAVQRYRWSSDREEDRFTVAEASTGETLAVIQGGGAPEIDLAVKAAHAAFESDWRWRPARERGRILLESAALIRKQAGDVAKLESRENGKPLIQSWLDVETCAASFEFFGGLIGRVPDELFDAGPVYGATFLEPFGVVAGILPFNWPPIHTAGKVAPALAVGNTVVLKPPEQTPLCVLEIVEILSQALPKDVLHAVPGHGPTAGAALVSHPLVRKVSFTGATKTGAAVLKLCADNITPALVELGGKNAVIVLEDADVGLALRGALEAAFYNQGQACTAGSRLLVHRSLHDAVAERLGAAVKKLRVGASLDPETHVGPLVSRAQQQRVFEYLRIGVDEGATIAAQAPLPADPRLLNGFFVPPTLFTGVRPEMRIAREEIFGPVVAMIAFDTQEEAIEIANGTEYGLVAGVYTRDHAKAMKVARSLDAGIVYVNNYYRGLYGAPFGGAKHSGYGREHTLQTLREFGRTKTVSIPSGIGETLYWPAVSDVGL